jgi:hypothetical protein
MNLNKVLTFFVILMIFCLGRISYASSLLVFDSPSLIVLQSGEKMYGYYAASEKNNSCIFFFTGGGEKHKKTADGIYSIVDIKTYALGGDEYHYEERDVQYDKAGDVYTMGDQWIIQTIGEPPGCGGATGFFHLDPYEHDAFRYYVTKRIPAIGIRIVSNKSFFYDARGVQFVKRKGYVTSGDVVAVLKESGGFSYVRYTDPDYFSQDPGRITSGWVRSVDLTDPFP